MLAAEFNHFQLLQTISLTDVPLWLNVSQQTLILRAISLAMLTLVMIATCDGNWMWTQTTDRSAAGFHTQSNLQGNSFFNTGSLFVANAGLLLLCQLDDLVLSICSFELIGLLAILSLFLSSETGTNSTLGTRHRVLFSYVFLHLISLALLLYGASFLYGLTGTTRLSEMVHSSTHLWFATPGTLSRFGMIAIVLIVLGLGFSLGLAPMHLGLPELYQHSQFEFILRLSVVLRWASCLLLLKILPRVLPHHAATSELLFIVLGLGTMLLPVMFALTETNLKRLFAYLTISQTGLISAAVAVSCWELQSHSQSPSAQGGLPGGTTLAYFLLLTEVTVCLGFLCCCYSLWGRESEAPSMDQLKGLFHSHPMAAFVFSVCFLSWSGLPPTSGFPSRLLLVLESFSVHRESISGQLAIPGPLHLVIGIAVIIQTILLTVVGSRSLLLMLSSSSQGQSTHRVNTIPLLVSVICMMILIALGLAPQKMMSLVAP